MPGKVANMQRRNLISKILSALTPVLAGVYPVLYLAGVNQPLLKPGDITRSILFVALVSLLLFLVGLLMLRNKEKSAIISTLALTLFFSYGQFYSFFERKLPVLGHHSVLVPFFTIIFGFAVWFVIKKRIKLGLVQNVLIVLGVLMAYTLITQLIIPESKTPNTDIGGIVSETVKNSVSPLPDVYFIVLDGYARADVWKEFYKYDNSPFLTGLEKEGFRVIDCSQSNYTFTKLSISSTLNYDYHPVLPDSNNVAQERKVDRSIVYGLQHSKVRQTLEALGYKTIALETGYSVTELVDADEYIKVQPDEFVLSQFENLVYDSTAMIAVRDLFIQIETKDTNLRALLKTYNKAKFFYYLNRDNMTHLEATTQIKGPKFVFAHIYTPHEPFTMAADGSFLLDGEVNEEPYVTQARYLNPRITEVLRKIISESEIPPIIVLESDHGMRQDLHLSTHVAVSNLMAFYGPDEVKQKLYDTMTPVKSFRVVLSYITGEEIPLLPDRSFYIYHAGDANAIPVDQMCPVKIPEKKNKTTQPGG